MEQVGVRNACPHYGNSREVYAVLKDRLAEAAPVASMTHSAAVCASFARTRQRLALRMDLLARYFVWR